MIESKEGGGSVWKFLIFCGFICLILAPLIRETVVGAVAFFFIAFINWKMSGEDTISEDASVEDTTSGDTSE